MEDPGTGPSSRDALFNAGWRQGAVFKPNRDLYSLVNQTDSLEPKSRQVKASELLVIVSHDCDIASDGYPHIECLVCEQLKQGKRSIQQQTARITLEDPRRFVVNREQGWVADTKHRILLQKSLLEKFPVPEYHISDLIEVDRFRKWLANRYARPGREGWIHDLVIRSLIGILRTIQDEEPDTFTVFNEIVHEVRFDAVAMDEGQVRLGLLIISNDDEQLWTDERISALENVTSTVEATLIDHDRIDFAGIQVTVLSELLHIAYLRTEALPTDWASYEDGQYVGAPPVDLVPDDTPTESGSAQAQP